MVAKINARTLIMDLLFADTEQVMSSRQFLLAAQLFGLTDNNIRVALTRLSTEGMIESVSRGLYQLTEQAREISEPLINRSKGLKTTRAWTGEYLAVHTGALGRIDRGALKRRERTLRLNGFRELQSGLFIRPDNLDENFEVTRERLIHTGLDASAAVYVVRCFNDEVNASIAKLWDCKLLNERYHKNSQHIQDWLARVDQLDLEVAARESLLIGRQAIPLLMTDPLLPEPFVDIQARQQFSQDVQQLDQVGHQLWNQFYLENADPDKTQNVVKTGKFYSTRPYFS